MIIHGLNCTGKAIDPINLPGEIAKSKPFLYQNFGWKLPKGPWTEIGPSKNFVKDSIVSIETTQGSRYYPFMNDAKDQWIALDK